MNNIIVSMKLTPKQAGALYVKSMRLDDEVKSLKAQVEQLRAHLKSVLVRYDNGAGCIDADGIELGNAFRFDDGEFNRLAKLVETTPAQCLAEIKAQAVESIDAKEFIAMAMRHCDIKGDFSYSDVSDAFNFIANQIRASAKGGE